MQNIHFTTCNNLTKYLSFCGALDFIFYQKFEYPKLDKQRKFCVRHPYIGYQKKPNPFITFGQDILAYLKHIGVQIKEKITGKTASVFVFFYFFFLAKYGAEKSSL